MGTSGAAEVVEPTVDVKETIDEVLSLVTNEDLKKSEQLSHRRLLLEEAIGQRFSFSEMAQRTLAAHLTKRSEEEQKEFVRLFQALLSKAYAGKIENYSGEEVRYLKARV